MSFEKWNTLKAKTAALSLRERGIMLVVAIVLVFFIWAQFYFLSFEKELKTTKTEISKLQQLELSQQDELQSLMARLADDPNAQLLAEQRQINSKLDKLKEQIEIRLSHLIEPELMADVMRNVLSDYKGLRLVSAKNLEVEPLNLSEVAKKEANKTSSKSEDEDQAVLFSHRFEMVLNGSYFQTIAFLKRLEEMKGFYWTMLKYEVEEYPNAKVTLQLSTLSLDEDWIGV